MQLSDSRGFLRYASLVAGGIVAVVIAWGLAGFGVGAPAPVSHGASGAALERPIAAVAGGEVSDVTRAEVSSDNFLAVIEVTGVASDDTATFDVIVQRASNGYCSALRVSSKAVWKGRLVNDLYEIVGVSCPKRAYEIVGARPVLRSEQATVSLNVARRTSWRLCVSDALDGSTISRGVTVHTVGRDIPFDSVACAAQVPVEDPGATSIYQVSALGYGEVDVRHHASQGDVDLLLWPSGTMRLRRVEACRLTIWRKGGRDPVYSDDRAEEGTTSVDLGAGSFEVTAAWAFGATSMRVEVRPGEVVNMDIEPPMPVPTEIHLTGQLPDRLVEQAAVTLHASIAGGRSVARRSWFRYWPEVTSSKLADWRVQIPGQHYVLSIYLLPGRYTAALSHLGCQAQFDVIAGQPNTVAWPAYDVVPTSIVFEGWKDEHWPIQLFWRYDGDATDVAGMICHAGEPVEALFLRRPLEVSAFGQHFAWSLPQRFHPGTSDSPLRLSPNGSNYAVEIVMSREGMPAHIQGQISFNAEPIEHDGELTSWGKDPDYPWKLRAKFTKPGAYRARGTMNGVVVFDHVLQAIPGRSQAVVLVQ